MDQALAPRRIALECLIAFCCGAAVLIVPVALAPETFAHPYPAKLLPLVATAAKRVEPYSFALLVVLGLALGYFTRTSAMLLAVCSVLLFPLWSTVDVFLGGDHNLLPFEWLAYAFYALLSLAGIAAARIAKRYVASGA
jgi:hypothetical protein